ncbi:MAG: MBL fold metallo-hydrolase [Candidatus Methylopumilus sp.]|nr:MBL fold metallo-hydrolase [Candidatus Methylopumilus sp.]
MELTILGAGSSAGTPVVGCQCKTCQSTNPKNKRTRCSSLIKLSTGEHILIDTSPDLRFQSLRESIPRIDAVLYTHTHADHLHGIDDLRAFCQMHKIQIPLYGKQEALDQIVLKFGYALNEPRDFWEMPILKAMPIDGPFQIFNMLITPIPVSHGKSEIYGYRIGKLAYLTDVSNIVESSLKLLEGLDLLLLDCLRMKEHHTHINLEQSMIFANQIKAKKTYLIHMTHDLEYEALKKELPQHIDVGYDGLKITIN